MNSIYIFVNKLSSMRTPLQKGEKILLVTYSSWVSLINPILLIIAGFVASYFIGFLHYGWILPAIAILYFVIKYYSWKSYIWVVTNYRVIDEVGLFKHFAKESPLDKINNVSYGQTVWGRILNYGDVEIQTAAQVGATNYFNVHHPKRLKDTITQAQADFTNYKSATQASQMASALGGAGGLSSTNLSSELEKLFELKQKGVLSEDEYNRAKNKLLNN
jgi:uncharacterized membrane protein YdbT with pleckstrin-like domain